MKRSPQSAILPAVLAIVFTALITTISVVQNRQNVVNKAKEIGFTPAPSPHQNAKITICHVPPGNPKNAQEIEVNTEAWESGHDVHNSHKDDYVVTQLKTCPLATLGTPIPTASPLETPIN